MGNRDRSFTLIELIVVVGIIAIISGLLIPVLSKARARARRARAKQKAAAQVESQPTAKVPIPEGTMPVITQFDLDMSLSSEYASMGMDVFTRHAVTGKATVAFHASESKQSVLMLPLPEQRTELRNLVLRISYPDGKVADAQGVVVHATGIYWPFSPTSGRIYKAEFRFTSLGGDRFSYHLPRAKQLSNVSIGLDLTGAAERHIPATVLQPTRANGNRLEWMFHNVISDRHIAVNIPAGQSSLGRVSLLCRLVAVAVMLFGIGFWHMAELSEPGRMRTFRWGHFLLLALTYSLFFVVFGVISFNGGLGVGWAILIAAAVALPLLILHVASVINYRFAWVQSTALSVYTLAIVVNGVYGGSYRIYGYLAALVVAITYFTLTYRRWVAQRTVYRDSIQGNHDKRSEELGMLICDNLRPVAESAESAVAATGDLAAAMLPSACRSLQQRLNKIRGKLTDLVRGAEDLSEEMVNAQDSDPEVMRVLLNQREKTARSLIGQLRKRLADLDHARERLEVEIPRHSVPQEEDGHVFCVICGSEIEQRMYCPDCGARQPHIISCGSCGDEILVPSKYEEKDLRSLIHHCRQCGAAHSPA